MFKGTRFPVRSGPVHANMSIAFAVAVASVKPDSYSAIGIPFESKPGEA